MFPIQVQRLLPKMVVVPPESAYPGFGDFVMLHDMDHIQVHNAYLCAVTLFLH